VTYRERLHSRIELATLLFPEREESLARANLRTALYHLKRMLTQRPDPKRPYLLISRDTIGFNSKSDYRLDVEEFETLLERASRAPPQQAYEMRLEALKLYRGDFLAGYYEDWGLREQERLRTHHQETLAAVSDYEERHGLLLQALTHLRELLALSPIREEYHRRLIRLFLHQGETAEAWKQYRLCERLLAVELGVAPQPETEALRLELERHPPGGRRSEEEAYEELERGHRALAQGHRGTAERLLLAARRRLAELRDSAEAQALFHLGRLALQNGQTALAERRFRRARIIARRAQDVSLQALALNGLGATESARGRLDQAREFYQSALKLAEAGHDLEVRWRALNNLGRNHWLLGRYEEALRCYVRAQLLCEQLHDRRGLLIVLQNLGTLYSHLGIFTEAHRCYEETRELAEGSGDPMWSRTLWHNWGDIYERQGEAEKAQECYRRGYRISWELGDALGCAANLCNLGRALCVLGDLRRAERYLTRALRRGKDLESANLKLEVHCALSAVRMAQGRSQEALELSGRAISLMREGVAVEEPENVYLVHAAALKSVGDRVAAQKTLRRAWELLQGRASRLKREDYRRSFFEDVPRRRLIAELISA